MNDLRLNELCVKIRQNADKLQEMQREQMELALFVALSDIEKEARAAQFRLNDLVHEQG